MRTRSIANSPEARMTDESTGRGEAISRLREETITASRRLGGDPFLVLAGGGNTSAKNDEYLWAKASGFDLATLSQEGLVQLRRADLVRMLERDWTSDSDMMIGYANATVGSARPAPTIESLLHHALPAPSVLHTHADAIVCLTDTVHGLDLVTEVLGDEVVCVPYVMPGFELAKRAHELWSAGGGTARALVLQHHGLFTMGQTVAEALELHLELVERAEAFLANRARPVRGAFEGPTTDLVFDTSDIARRLMRDLRDVAQEPFTALQWGAQEARDFLGRSDLVQITQRGPTTLEHVIRTKRVPLIGDDVAGYAATYDAYFERNAGRHDKLVRLNPMPRVVLHPSLGLIAIGPSHVHASAVMDIYRHTIRIIEAAEMLGGYRTVTESQAFDIEYWELEQRRL